MAGSLDLSQLNVISPNGLYTTSLATSDSNAFVMPKAIDLTAGQIKFPATQVPSSDANTLDDYEEGTWTPTIIGSTTAGTNTYTMRLGKYTKIGRKVTATFHIVLSTTSGMVGNAYIDGLPFNVLEGDFYPTIFALSSFGMASGYTVDYGALSIGTTIKLVSKSNGSWSYIPVANVSGCQIIAQISYETY